MWKIDSSKIKKFGGNNEISVVKTGFLQYAAVQQDGLVIFKSFKLRKFFNKILLPGRIMKAGGDGIYTPITEYILQFENPNPKKYGEYITVCSWEVYEEAYTNKKC